MSERIGELFNPSRGEKLSKIAPQFCNTLYVASFTGNLGEPISFGVLVQLIADALLEHQGSGKKSFERG